MLSRNLLSEIKRKSDELNALKPLKPEHQARLDKKFRLEFNFNSNHLEGNTLTYGETELLLIFDKTDGTHNYREYQEMQAHDVALRMVKEEALDKERPLTENFIKELNEILLVKPFWKDATTHDGHPTRKQIIPGKYKETPNSVRLDNGEIFNYSAPGDVQNEIAELVKWLNEKSETEDRVLLASLLHYRFVRIHPFDDGNGRTARLLMNYVFVKNILPLVIIKSAEKKAYLAALNRADTGNLNAFVEYIGNQLLWSLNISIKAAKGEDIDEEEDLDKELELLKLDLKQFPDEYNNKKSAIEVAEVMSKSIIPLYYELESKLNKIRELFVEIDNFILMEYRSSPGSLNQQEIRKPFIEKISEEEFVFSPFEKYDITSLSLMIHCKALKKVVIQKDISYSFYVFIGDYHYGIADDVLQKDLIRLPYGKFLDRNEINSIVKTVMTYIIEEIKSATTLKN